MENNAKSQIYSNVANSLLRIDRGVALSTDRERERGGHEERERRGILPVRSVDQRLVETIRVTTAQPIRISLGFCENL